MKRGTLIAFEGLDGSGKSTQIGALRLRLGAAGHEVITTREPTDGPTGRRIRAMAAGGPGIPAEEELRWFVEDRRVHVAEVIAPALEQGRVVLTDRYYLSSVAYQGARGLDAEAILAASEAEFPAPDLALILEIDPTAGLARVHARGMRLEPAFERLEFLERVAALFHAIERPYVERVDARPDPEAVAAAIAERVQRRLGLL